MILGQFPASVASALQSKTVQNVLQDVGVFVLVIYALRRSRRLRHEESSLALSERPWNYRFGTTI